LKKVSVKQNFTCKSRKAVLWKARFLRKIEKSEIDLKNPVIKETKDYFGNEIS